LLVTQSTHLPLLPGQLPTGKWAQFPLTSHYGMSHPFHLKVYTSPDQVVVHLSIQLTLYRNSPMHPLRCSLGA